MNHEFCPELSAAIDRKTTTDAALLRLRQEILAGRMPNSKSVILSAMEDCDDAMDDIWQAVRPTVLPSAPQEWIDVLKQLNVGGPPVMRAVESAGCTIEDIRAQKKAAG